MQMDGTTIFVYGTLKRGCRNHSAIQSGAFLGEARTEPGYGLVDCGSYPGLVRAEGCAGVAGELYLVDEELLAALDRFENAPNEFERAAIRLSDGREAQAYFYRGETACLPACGPVWREG
jgi:gamma-glutamylaminecyclotransferase